MLYTKQDEILCSFDFAASPVGCVWLYCKPKQSQWCIPGVTPKFIIAIPNERILIRHEVIPNERTLIFSPDTPAADYIRHEVILKDGEATISTSTPGYRSYLWSVLENDITNFLRSIWDQL